MEIQTNPNPNPLPPIKPIPWKKIGKAILKVVAAVVFVAAIFFIVTYIWYGLSVAPKSDNPGCERREIKYETPTTTVTGEWVICPK